jgi:hypothetical protein
MLTTALMNAYASVELNVFFFCFLFFVFLSSVGVETPVPSAQCALQPSFSPARSSQTKQSCLSQIMSKMLTFALCAVLSSVTMVRCGSGRPI